MVLKEDYAGVGKRIVALCEGGTDRVALMATIACEVYAAGNRFDPVGFYRNVVIRMLKIGPFQAAVASTETALNVPDVDAFSSHIACSSSTRSELVLPVFNCGGSLIAVFDIDSDQPAAFLPEDQDQLQSILDAVFRQLP